MLIRETPPVHLTYCLNVHKGESWAEKFAASRKKTLGVRDLVAPGRQFGLGLRLSAQAAREGAPTGRPSSSRSQGTEPSIADSFSQWSHEIPAI